MKKPILALLIITLAFTAFSACADNDADKDDKNSPLPEETLVSELDPDSRSLIKSLTDYLMELNINYDRDLPELNLKSRIDKINAGAMPLLLHLIRKVIILSAPIIMPTMSTTSRHTAALIITHG